MFFWINVTLTVVVVYFTFRIVLSALAANDNFVTFREEGKVKFVMKGDVVARLLFKSRDHVLDQKTGKIYPTAKYDALTPNEKKDIEIDEPGPFELLFGVYLVGFPPYKVKYYPFTYDRFVRNDDDPTMEGYQVDPKNKQIVHRTSQTNYLALRREFPIIAMDVETMDRSDIKLEGTMTVVADNAIQPVIVLEGDWYNQVSNAVVGAITEFAKQYNITDFTAVPKSWEASEATKWSAAGLNAFRSLPANAKKTDKRNQPAKSLRELIEETTEGITRTTGMRVEVFNYKQWDPSDEDVKKAARREELNMLEGKGLIATAKAERKATEERGMGVANAAQALIDKLKDADAGTIAVLVANAERDSLTSPNSKLTTLFKGNGTGPGVVVSTPPPAPVPPTTNP